MQTMPMIEQKESIKLIKNSKGYNWEIKLTDGLHIEKQLKRLDEINKELEKLYGMKGGKK